MEVYVMAVIQTGTKRWVSSGSRAGVMSRRSITPEVGKPDFVPSLEDHSASLNPSVLIRVWITLSFFLASQGWGKAPGNIKFDDNDCVGTSFDFQFEAKMGRAVILQL